jgi:hypothetical protein
VNLRSDAALDPNNVIRQLDPGTALTVTGDAVTADGFDWEPVATDQGENGFVAKQYLAPAG